MSRHLVLHLQYLHLVRRGCIVLDIDKPETERSLLNTLVRGYSPLSVLKCTAVTNVGSAVYKVSPAPMAGLCLSPPRQLGSAAPVRGDICRDYTRSRGSGGGTLLPAQTAQCTLLLLASEGC